jgi:hypothetical protein
MLHPMLLVLRVLPDPGFVYLSRPSQEKSAAIPRLWILFFLLSCFSFPASKFLYITIP